MGEKAPQPRNLRTRAKALALSAVVNGLQAAPRVERILVERAKQLFAIEDPQNFVAKAAEMAGRDKLLIIYGNHLSHSDLVPMAQLSQQIGEATGRTFLTPFAASVESGDQGSVLQSLLHIAQPALMQHHMELVSFVRKADNEQYGLQRDGNMDSTKRMLRGLSFSWLPEGTLKGARRNAKNEQYGMQIPPDEFEHFMDRFLRSGKQIIFLPVGIEKSDLVMGPDSRKPSGRALRRLVAPWRVRPMASVTIGQPFEMSLATKPADMDVRTIVMQHIAPLVPEEIQGAYKQTK